MSKVHNTEIKLLAALCFFFTVYISYDLQGLVRYQCTRLWYSDMYYVSRKMWQNIFDHNCGKTCQFFIILALVQAARTVLHTHMKKIPTSPKLRTYDTL